MGAGGTGRPSVRGSVSELVEAIWASGSKRVFVARALEPSMRRSVVEACDAVELPFVRGRVVVPPDLADDDLVVAGHPNHLGIFDLPGVRWLAVIGRWSALREAPDAVSTVTTQPPLDAGTAATALAAAEHLAKLLGQLGGVTVAFPVESPVLVLLLAGSSDRVAAQLQGATTLDGYPELPGGLRIEVQVNDVEGYAAALERAISEER